MATKKSYYGRDKNYSGSVSRWLGYLKKGNKADSIFREGITELDRILDNQITFAKAREAKFEKELDFMNDFFNKMNDGTIQKDSFDMIIDKVNELTANPEHLFKEIKSSKQYLVEAGILDIDETNLLELYLQDANKSKVKMNNVEKFMHKITTTFSGDYNAKLHYKILSILGLAKEQHLVYKLEEYLKKYINLNTDKIVNNSIQIIENGTSQEKADLSVSFKNSDDTIDNFGISSKLAEEDRFYRSGINFHSTGNTAFTLNKIFKVFNIKNYALRRLLTGLIYHSGARMTKETEGEEGAVVENIKYQQWYEYNKEFANKLAAIMASAVIGDQNISLFSSHLTGNNQVDFLYLGNKIIPKSSVLEKLRNGQGQVITNFYTSKISRNFVVNDHSFGFYAKKGRVGQDDSEVEAVVNQLLEQSGLRGIRIKYKIKEGGIIK